VFRCETGVSGERSLPLGCAPPDQSFLTQAVDLDGPGATDSGRPEDEGTSQVARIDKFSPVGVSPSGRNSENASQPACVIGRSLRARTT